MKRNLGIAAVLGLAVVLSGCGKSVRRIDVDTQIDLSGRWNDTDSRLVSEEMISDCLSRPWLNRHISDTGGEPSVMVGTVRNNTDEHIISETFTKDLERAFINSGLVRVVASRHEREEIRDERADMMEWASEDTRKEMVYIGGGAGMAPLRSHIFHLFHSMKTDRKISYWYGARSKREIFYEDEFRKIEQDFPNFKFHIALSEPLPEDNWNGYKGFIHQIVLDNYLEKHPEPEELEYYLCGPPIMNESVLKMLDNLGVPEENIDLDDFGG